MILNISLLIATIHREAELDHLLSCLQKQSYRHFHVYIADQNPQGFLATVLHPHIKHLSVTTVPMPACGVSAARNALLPLAKGDIVAFPDDDCWYEPDTLAAVVHFFRENSSCAGILGTWVESGKKPSAIYKGEVLTRYSAFAGSETYVQFYRREVVQAVEDFDNTLGPGTGLPWGCGEDTDYVLRAIARNFCIRRAPSVKVHHPCPALSSPLAPRLLQKYHAYALGRMYLLRKHNFPLWFKLANVLYPVWRALVEGSSSWEYRWSMFKGRLKGLLG